MNLEGDILGRVALLLSVISILLWSYFLKNAELYIGSYGLANSLNIYYFLSMFCLIISFLLLIICSNYTILIVDLTYFYLMLYILPFILEKSAFFPYSYLTYGYTEYILRNSHINADILNYQSWPGLMYLGSFLVILSGLSESHVIICFQIFSKILSIILIYLIFSLIFEDKKIRFLGILIYLLGDWTAQSFYTPPALGFLFYLLALYLFLLMLYNRKIKLSSQWSIIILIVIFALIETHMLSSIVSLFSIISILLAWKLIKNIDRIQKFSKLIILFFSTILLWHIYIIPNNYSNHLSSSIKYLFNIFGIVSSTENSVFGLGLEHTNVMHIKFIYTIVFYLIAILGILFIVLGRNSKKSDYVSISLMIILSNSILIPLIVGPYSGEILSRAFNYSAPFLAVFIAANKNEKLFYPIIIGFLIIAPVFFNISAYGNHKFDYVSYEELSGAKFYYEFGNSNEFIQSLNERIWRFRYIENDKWKKLKIDYFNSTKLFAENSIGYVALYERDTQGYAFFNKDITEIFKDHLNNIYFDKICNSNNFELYLNSN
jgi:hypothetical protein